MLGFLWRDLKSLVETAIRSFDPKIIVQNDEWLAQGRNDALAVVDSLLRQLFCLAAFRDVSENQYHTSNFSAGTADLSGTILNWSFSPVFCDEQRVVSLTNHHAFAQGTSGRVLGRLASFFIDDLENALERNTCRPFLRPAGQRLSDRIEKSDAAFDVSRNHCIANA
jgi:hypothetical protein